MDNLLNNIIKATGWTIIHSLWQGAILYIILILILNSRSKLNSALRHNLSFLSLTGTFVWSAITFYTEFKNACNINEKSESVFGSVYAGGRYVSFVPETIISRLEQVIPMLAGVYLIGILVQMSLILFDFYKLNRIRTIGLTDLTPDLKRRFEGLADKLGINRMIRFNVSSGLTVPLVVGYFKPVILLPFSVITQLEINQLEAIIIHELTHIRRNDYILNIIKICFETILFFNPFVLMTGKIINTERENACDDLVVDMTGNPLLYVETLFRIQASKVQQERFSMALTGKNYELLDRIKRIATGETRKLQTKQPIALLLIIAAFLSFAWIPIQYEEHMIKPVLNTYKPANKVLIPQKETAGIIHNKTFRPKRQPVYKSTESLSYQTNSSTDSIVKPPVDNTVADKVVSVIAVPRSDRPISILNIRTTPQTNEDSPPRTDLSQ